MRLVIWAAILVSAATRRVNMFRRTLVGLLAMGLPTGLAGGALAKDVVFYKIGKLPDFSGIVVKDGNMFAPFEMIDTGYNGAGDGTGRMKMLVKLGPGGKQNCTTSEWVDDDTTSYVKSCASVADIGSGRYTIKVVVTYDNSAWLATYPEDLQMLKKDNHVKERRYEIDFSISGRSCSATMVKRTYIPLDGRKRVPSTVGDLGCTVNRN
ncbi:hypothetical protein HFO42_07580 [Rhizobium leguminosarum]|uniref:Uncharacterized protein n=1 Tax=Rhizobium leguminosarum TaxID=384 RepID=A0AAJ1A6E5_RHILE|nr:hypothetical protein [Rhizobium leguminosarum]MBY5532823.1 hypothetical protein [Rhizobium leguminosarum]MBY5594299.1 hypothetical protein [Rhizobium leguminosarum]MBY5627976.1 hypothetical protein [Rhizobium leguminosarum]